MAKKRSQRRYLRLRYFLRLKNQCRRRRKQLTECARQAELNIAVSCLGLEMLEPRVLLSGDPILSSAPLVDMTTEASVVVANANSELATPVVIGRHVFYNDSSFDGRNKEANDLDDNAIASDKIALRPGDTAQFKHHTSYLRGINGVMVDILGLSSQDPVPGDFVFRVGNDNNPSAWQVAPQPQSIMVRRGVGDEGSDRVTITWSDNTIRNQWLQVTVKATANMGLANDDVFYFGNAIGNTSDSQDGKEIAEADMNDAIDVRNNTTKPGVTVDTENQYDIDRNGVVNVLDFIVALDSASADFPALQLFTAPYISGGEDVPDVMPVPVLRVDGDLSFSGEDDDYLEVSHTPELALANGTIALTFTAQDVWGWHALFSKDAKGQEQGGHLTAFVVDTRIKVRLQNQGDGERWLYTEPGLIVAGQEYHVAVTFGDDGFWLYVDGQMKDWDLEFKQDLTTNTQSLAIGASIWSRSASHPDTASYEFHGVISDFRIYDYQFDDQQVAVLASFNVQGPSTAPPVIDDVLVGLLADGVELITNI